MQKQLRNEGRPLSNAATRCGDFLACPVLYGLDDPPRPVEAADSDWAASKRSRSETLRLRETTADLTPLP